MNIILDSLPRAGVVGCLAVAAAIGLAACSDTSAPTQTTPLVVSNKQSDKWVRNFNPFSDQTDLLWPTLGGVYEPLMVLNSVSGLHEPWLATEYEWDETDQVLTFTLRDGVRWSDGEDFSADDVAFTFNLLRAHPEVDHNRVWAYLGEVSAQEGNRVAFVFSHTFVPGLELVARQVIVPGRLWSEVDDPLRFRNETPVGTGPFTEVLSFDEKVYDLGRNAHYWQPGKPKVEVVRVPIFRNNEEAVAALKAGEVDWSGNFVPDVRETYLAVDPDRRGFWSPLIDGPVLLIPNTTRPPLDDVRVRRALSRALDRDRLCTEAMNGYTRPADATGLDDGKLRFRNDEAAEKGTWTHFDSAEAERLLDEVGLQRGDDGVRIDADGEPVSLSILVPGGWSDWVETARISAESLEAIGIAAVVEPVPMPEWQGRGQRGDFDLAIGLVDAQARLTPYLMYRSLISAKGVRPIGEPAILNWHRFSDPQADAFLEAFELTSDEEIQRELLRRVQDRFVETVPVIPLFLAPSWGTFNSSRFEGFPTERNPFARLSPNIEPECLLVLTELRPRR